ncbi:MAG: hypothetical protein RL220_264 [Bacteroidota bacterium]
MKSFLSKVVILAIALCAGIFAVTRFAGIPIPPAAYGVVVAFALLTWILYRNIMSSVARNPRRFVSAIMGSVTIKLLACAVFVAVYAYLKLPGKVEMALTLFMIYAANTALLTGQVSRQLRT